MGRMLHDFIQDRQISHKLMMKGANTLKNRNIPYVVAQLLFNRIVLTF